jgi:hypothetical protein
MQAISGKTCQRGLRWWPMHTLQGVWQVHRQAARRDEDDVEPLLVVAVSRITADPEFGCPGDAAGLAQGDCGFRLAARRPPLDLHEREPAPAHRDDVDLAIGGAAAPREDAVTPRQQRRGGQPLRDAPAPVASDSFRAGRLAAHDLSSRI